MNTSSPSIVNAAAAQQWDEAVIALCNALADLPPQRRRALAREVVHRSETWLNVLSIDLLRGIQNSAQAKSALPAPAPVAAEEPAAVQLRAAKEIVADPAARRSDDDAVLRLASAISSAVFAVQCAIWARRNKDQYRKWLRDEIPEQGVYDDPRAVAAGQLLWSEVHSLIAEERVFRGVADDRIYRRRPIQKAAQRWLEEQLF